MASISHNKAMAKLYKRLAVGAYTAGRFSEAKHFQFKAEQFERIVIMTEEQLQIETIIGLRNDIWQMTIKSSREYEQAQGIRDSLQECLTTASTPEVTRRINEALQIIRGKLRTYEDGPAYDKKGNPI